jgi:hypothetical protein
MAKQGPRYLELEIVSRLIWVLSVVAITVSVIAPFGSPEGTSMLPYLAAAGCGLMGIAIARFFHVVMDAAGDARAIRACLERITAPRQVPSSISRSPGQVAPARGAVGRPG